MHIRLITAVSFFLGLSTILAAAVVVTGPTTDWTAVSYPGVQSDYIGDQQTGIYEFDIVGDANNPGFYTQFDGGDDTSHTDGEIAFRFRLNGNKSPSYFEGLAWVGMDVNNDGALDLFVGAENKNSSSWDITINDAGPGANTSPSTTTINTTALYTSSNVAGQYSWGPVTNTNDPLATTLDVGGDGNTDYFISFKLSFSALVSAVNTLIPGANFDDTKGIAYVVATATQGNSLNADLNGVDGGGTSTLTWEVLGALSPELGVDGLPIVPEPSATALVAGLGAFLLLIRRRQ